MTEIVLADGTKAETKIVIPEQYHKLVEDVRLLVTDQCNPNVMSKEQHEAVWHSLQKFGWVYPIITNKDGVLGDGEQRVTVCLNKKEYYAPVLRIPLSDIDRRVIRQVLNKLKGEHQPLEDAQEYLKIIEAGQRDDLTSILLLRENEINKALDLINKNTDDLQNVPYSETFEIIISCKDELEQKEIYSKLTEEGYICRVLTL